MGKNAALQCRCGAVRGVVADAAPGAVNRAVCYCDDCQAYLHHLGRTDLFDAHGGTDVVQVAPASLSFIQGKDRIQGLRLSPKGLHRWYASCCKTPLGNTVGPAMPFIGIVARVFDSASQKTDDVFGPPIGAVHGKFAVGDAPEGSTGFKARLIARMLRKIVGWRLTGRTWPHPFFDRATRQPIYPLTTLSRAEREALRPLCGPRPSAAEGRTG
jgi:hypothetical protein